MFLTPVVNLLKKNRHLHRLIDSVYDSYVYMKNSRVRRSIQREGWEVLGDIHELFTEAGIPYFVDFGTLLGIIREGGFIKHDLDIDIGVLDGSEKMRDKIKAALSTIGFRPIHSYWYMEQCKLQSYSNSSVKVDFGFYIKSEHGYSCMLFKKDISSETASGKAVYIPIELHYTSLKKIIDYEIKGITTRIPGNYEEFLEEKYGKNWRVPDSKWRYWQGPTAREVAGEGVMKIDQAAI